MTKPSQAKPNQERLKRLGREMRPLTEEETRQVFEKLAKYVGSNLKQLIDTGAEAWCFRLQKDRVYYVRESVMRHATTYGRAKVAALGVCVGKFTHNANFHLHITFLPYLAKYAKYKVWVKPSSEMSFMYGNHVLKAGVGRFTDTPQGQGIVVYSMGDIPIGFGITARSTHDTRKANPMDIIVLNQADVGQYLRNEESNPASAL